MLGDFYFAIGELDKAVSEYRSLHNDHPKDVQVSKNYVQLLRVKNRVDEANKLNEEVLKSKPKDDEALTYRGEIQLAQGKVNDAVQTLQSVVSSNPVNAVAHFHLGNALNQRAELEQAAKEWQEAARLKPQMVEAQRALAGYALAKGDMAGLEPPPTQPITPHPRLPPPYPLRPLSFTLRRPPP